MQDGPSVSFGFYAGFGTILGLIQFRHSLRGLARSGYSVIPTRFSSG